MFRIAALSFCSIALFAQTQGTIQTIAGNGSTTYSGDGGPATSAGLNVPVYVAHDSSGNLYITDQFNHRIRMVTPSGTISTVAGNGSAGFSGDGGPATSAQINTPTGVFVDSFGNLYIADVGNQRIRKVNTAGVITTIAGNGAKGYGGDGGPATGASFYNCVRVIVDAAGNVLIADQSNHRVRRINASGIITTFAGNGVGTPQTGAFSGDGGPATAASLNNPTALAVDPSGVVYIADQFNQRVRKVALDGTINTIAGNGAAAFAGDGGPATSATLNYPGGLTLDSSGNLYINDDLNYRIRKVSTSGTITSVAGNGNVGFTGDGGPATSASLNGNFGIEIDSSGNLYIADSVNNRIREVYGVAPVNGPTLSGTAVNSADFTSKVAPGSFASIGGTNIATSIASAPSVPLGTALGGATVTINGTPAPLLYVSPTFINFQVPWETATGTASVVVSVNGVKSNSISANVVSAAPGIYQPSGPALAQVFSNGTVTGVNGPNLPAHTGDILIVYVNGIGAVAPPVTTGAVTPLSPTSYANVSATATINGVAATVGFTGLAPTLLATGIVNVTVPPGLGTGTFPLVINIGGQASAAANVTVTP